MDQTERSADGAASGAPDLVPAEVPDSLPEANVLSTGEPVAEVEAQDWNPRERWADVSEGVDAELPSIETAPLVEPSTGADVAEWVDVKLEAGVDADGSAVVEPIQGDGAAEGAPAVPESEPTISVPDPRDVAQDLPETKAEEEVEEETTVERAQRP